MSTSEFHHSDSKIAHAMPKILAILDTQDGRIGADSELDAADKCTVLLRQPGKIARSAERRRAKVRGAIGVLINLGYVTFSPRTGLVMTSKGASALERRRASYTRQAGRKNGRQALRPSRA